MLSWQILFCFSAGLTPEARQAYDKALQGGKRKVPHIRALFCGPGRVGKTSLGRSLLGQEFKKLVDSTIGVELQKVVSTVRRQKGSRILVWRALKDEDEQQRLLAKKVLKEEVRDRETESSAGDSRDTADAKISELEPTRAHDIVRDTDVPPAVHPDMEIGEQPAQSSQHGWYENDSEENPDPASQPATSKDDIGAEPSPASSPSTTTPKGNNAAPQPSTRSRQPSESEEQTKLQAEARLYVRKFLKEIHQIPATAEDSLDDEMYFVDLWDFAGQESFAAVQHMLLSDLRCAYAVVFDMSLDLDAPVLSTFCREGMEQDIEGASIITNFDVVEGWLNTIHQAIGDTDAPVYIIGCQIDKVPPELREAKKKKVADYIWRNAESKAYKHNINDIVFVDNTLSGTDHEDPSVIQLRQDLIEMMSEQLEMPIPLRWLPFTVAVQRLARKKGMPWLSMDEVHEVAVEVCRGDAPDAADVDVHSLLQFHHHLGHVLYYANNPHLNDRVIIDVEWLLRIVSLLFVPQIVNKQSKRFRRHFDLLREKGILLESLAQHIWSSYDDRTKKYTQLRGQRDFLFNLMEEFSLLFNTGQTMKIGNSNPSRKFYIPALVTSVDDVRQGTESSLQESEVIYLYSGTKLLFPQTLFWCLVVCCMKHFKSDHDPVLHRNSARILCFDVFWLVLTYFQHGIKLVVEHEKTAAGVLADNVPTRSTARKLRLPEACNRILVFAEEQLEQLKGDALQHVQLRPAAHCNCRLNERKCAKHDASYCQHIDCRHFIELEIGEVARCPLQLKLAQNVDAVAQCWLVSPLMQAAKVMEQ